jgi:hypothetical protein
MSNQYGDFTISKKGFWRSMCGTKEPDVQWKKVISSLNSYLCWSPPVALGHTVCSIGPTYIFHTVMDRFLMSLGIIPFWKIFLTVLFDTLTNIISFLFVCLIKHLFKCVALLCIYIVVIVILIWDRQPVWRTKS